MEFGRRVWLRVLYHGVRSTLGDGVTGLLWMRATLGDVTELGEMYCGIELLRCGGKPSPNG